VRCGVTVHEGAILEAGAVVLKDVKPWMIVIENTARD
jgi:acetyltransferase-like isoleucine patch superfamily enzyme